MYRNICTAVLVLLVALLTLDNAHYYARASYLHLVPLLAFCGLAWALLGRDRGPTLGVTLWSLAGIGAVGVSLELIFQVYKHHPFDENGIVTMLSVCQLALISLVCFRLWQVRRAPGPWRLKNHSTIWLLIASGFAFLAVDEKALIHEGLDRSFHKLFAIQATGWTSRLDDMLIGLYGLIGLAVLWFYFAEIKRFRRCFRLLQIGFVALFLSVAADMASKRPDFFLWLLGPGAGDLAYAIVGGLEEVLKITSEALFLSGFYSAVLDVRAQRHAPEA